ncbi:MAG: hypothetical protein K2Q01_05025 [Rickettsiales bacterium]|nr:hypothetical protein [Rickettsiales bacterium]
MPKAIAIAKEDSLKAAIESAVNTAKLVQDFMYGTPERARYTTAFALGVVGLGMFMQSLIPTISNYCS